jgi:dihydrolipoamide dehydrogenase
MSHNDHLIYDVAVIGGGPGGYIAAIRACQLGLKTAIIEGDRLGGVCLNWGCIPTKSLLKSSWLFHMTHHLKSFGIEALPAVAHLKDMVSRSRTIAGQLEKGVENLLKKNGATSYKAWATLGEKTKEGRLIQLSQAPDTPPYIKARRIILATGAYPRTLFPEAKGIWSYKEAMSADSIPSSLLIIGAGAIGIEFASFYQSLGTSVTIVEQQARILPLEDEEISAIARQEFEKKGIKFYCAHTVTQLKNAESGFLSATIKNLDTQQEHSLIFEKALVAVGVTGRIQGIGLENSQVQTRNGYIVTTAYGQTHDSGIYAIGDVAGPPLLAHKASHEAIACIEHIAGLTPHTIKTTDIPSCTYSTPQIASIGLTEKQAEQRTKIKIGKFPFYANGQALAQGESVGLVKVIFDQNTGELLGAHLVGHGVTELIQGFVIAKGLEATEESLKHLIFPHPTLSEAMHEAILDADHMALHIFR